MAIGDYVDQHNEQPKPFIWTASAKDILAKVAGACRAGQSVRFRPHYTSIRRFLAVSVGACIVAPLTFGSRAARTLPLERSVRHPINKLAL